MNPGAQVAQLPLIFPSFVEFAEIFRGFRRSRELQLAVTVEIAGIGAVDVVVSQPTPETQRGAHPVRHYPIWGYSRGCVLCHVTPETAKPLQRP